MGTVMDGRIRSNGPGKSLSSMILLSLREPVKLNGVSQGNDMCAILDRHGPNYSGVVFS